MSKISDLVERHSEMRTKGINLIASENWLSPRVRDALSCDLAGRYHSEWYGGSEYAIEIIKETENLARKVFNVNHAIVTSLSGINNLDAFSIRDYIVYHESWSSLAPQGTDRSCLR